MEGKENEWTLFGEDKKTPLATFQVTEGKLSFQWDRAASTEERYLFQACRIRLEKDQPPILVSKPFAVHEGCLLPEKTEEGIDLLPASSLTPLHQILAKLSLGKWKLIGLPPEYEFVDSSSTLSPSGSLKPVVLKIRKSEIDIAELKVSLIRKDEKDKMSPLSIVDIKLMASIPNADPKRWSSSNQEDKDADHNLSILEEKLKKHFENAAKNKNDEAWISFAESVWDANGKVISNRHLAISEKKTANKLDPELTLKDDLSLNDNGLKCREGKKKAIRRYNEEEEKLKALKSWREGMDGLTELFKTDVTLSFDVFYDVKIDDKDVPVILGTVTTKLPSPKVGQ